MKTITFLKLITIVLGIAVLVCFFTVCFKIADITPKSKKISSNITEFALFPSEKIGEMVACGDKLCLLTTQYKNAKRLLIVNTKHGKIESIVTFENSNIGVKQ